MNFLVALALAGTVLTPPGVGVSFSDPDQGVFSPAVSRVVTGGGASTVTLDALPYTRTVTQDTYTVTGTWTGSAPTTWTASPSGDTGACSDTGGGTFSCVVDVDPDASGEGVETITIGTESVTIGFYVAGAHSAFLSQSVDGSYNSSMADLDAVVTWENVGTSALDVTQGTGSAQPTFRTGIVGGQPVVRCDGGDRLAAATASDWAFLHNGTDWTIDTVATTASANPNTFNTLTSTATGAAASRGIVTGFDDRSASSRNDTTGYFLSTGSSQAVLISTNDTAPSQRFNGIRFFLDDDGGAGDDMFIYSNGSLSGSRNSAVTYSALAPAAALNICNTSDASFPMTGDLFRVLIYESALTATQRAINQAVDEWALGQALPVVAPLYRLDSSNGDAITTAGGSVSDWRSQGITTASAVQATGAQQPLSTVSGAASGVAFDGTNDFVQIATQPTTPNSHIFAVVTIDAVDTNGSGASCQVNDGVTGWALYGGMKLRNDAGAYYLVGHNFDGSNDCAQLLGLPIGTRTLLEMKVDGTNVSVAIDGGAFTSSASGNTSAASDSVIVGARDASNDYFDGTVHEVLRFGDDLDTTTRNAVIADLQSKWGL